MSDITPAGKLASVLLEYDDGAWYADPLGGWVTTEVEGDTISLKVARYDETGEEVSDQTQHFRAVVVEGETVPIVLERPDISNPSAVTGPRFGEEAGESVEHGWSVFATDHVLFGGTGHVSPAEARRFAAALVATADALEAAQAQTGGAQ
ncbi:hypothetical protein [Nonomuraea sp. GTA35]|uniref:hypothetical protein n=1 Tax=Nonomuraea sp. GTA35 TaxID=1676746 RepID=UPI0035C1AC85